MTNLIDRLEFAREPGIPRIGRPAVTACASDLDDTLLATTKIEVASFHNVFSDLNRKFPEEVFYSRWNGRGGMFRLIAEEMRLGIPGDELKNQVRTHFNELTKDGIPYVPGAEEFLWHCNARGIGVAIATSSDRPSMFLKSERAGLDKYISAWASGHEVDHGKPAPDVFELALWKLNAPPGRSFGIGDTEHDMYGLEKAGVPLKVLVAGERGIAGRSTRADIVVKNPGELGDRFFDLLQGW